MTIPRRMLTSEIDPPTDFDIELSKIKIEGALFIPLDEDDSNKFRLLLEEIDPSLYVYIRSYIKNGSVLLISDLSNIHTSLLSYVIKFNSIMQVANYLTQMPIVSSSFGVSNYFLALVTDMYDYNRIFIPDSQKRIVSLRNISSVQDSHMEEISNIIKIVGPVSNNLSSRNLDTNSLIKILYPRDKIYKDKVSKDYPIYLDAYGNLNYNEAKAKSIRQHCLREAGFRYDRKAKVYTLVKQERNSTALKNLRIYQLYNICYEQIADLLNEIKNIIYIEKWWPDSIWDIEEKALDYDIKPIVIKIFNNYENKSDTLKIVVEKTCLFKTYKFLQETQRFERLKGVHTIKKLIRTIGFHSRRIPDRYLFQISYRYYYRTQFDNYSFLLWWINKCYQADDILPFDIGGYIKDAKLYHHTKTAKRVKKLNAQKAKLAKGQV